MTEDFQLIVNIVYYYYERREGPAQISTQKPSKRLRWVQNEQTRPAN